MYTSPTSVILGFHGCDQTLGERVLRGEIRHLSKSQNVYDWLGHGIYFWEYNPGRALEFAQDLSEKPRKRSPKISKPFVLGAIIAPGNCLNLLESGALQELKGAYSTLKDSFVASGATLPVNKSGAGTKELVLRDLDCAVVETLHATMKADGRPPVRHSPRSLSGGKAPLPQCRIPEKRPYTDMCSRHGTDLGVFSTPDAVRIGVVNRLASRAV